MASDHTRKVGPGAHKRIAKVPKHASLHGARKARAQIAAEGEPKERPNGKRTLADS